MTDQPSRVTPGEISALLDQARRLTAADAPLAEQIAYHERKAELLSRIAARLDTAEAHQVAADAWHYVGTWPASATEQEVTRVKMSAFSGQQLAQVDNPDPFAPPVWRSPVYHTPGWVITIVQLARVIVALVKFLARHPVLDLVLAVRAAGLAPGRMARPGHPHRHRDRRCSPAGGCAGPRRSPGSSAPRSGASGGAGTTSGTGWPC